MLHLVEKFMRRAHEMKASQFAEFSPAPGGVVFLGDSITEGGLWHEWFPDVPVINRGIDADTTEGVLARLNTVVTGPPAKVFLLIGTNDLTRKNKPAEISARVDRIIGGIHATAPDTAIVLQSVMPRHIKFRDRVTDLNNRYQEVALGRGATFLDLWPALADAEGGLRGEYTLDHLHLNGSGYRAWVEVLRDYVA